jgi:hypothetical protein
VRDARRGESATERDLRILLKYVEIAYVITNFHEASRVAIKDNQREKYKQNAIG